MSRLTDVSSILNQHNASDQFATVDDDKTLKVYERFVEIGEDAGAITLTLPPVVEAAGLIYSIYVPTTGTSSSTDCTLEDYSDDSYDWQGDFTLDADDDRILLYSDGHAWTVLKNNIA